MTLDDFATLEGLITHEKGCALAALAADVPPNQAIVEVGSYKGKSTCYLAYGAKHGAGAFVVAVDAWDLPGNTTGRFGYAEPGTRDAFEAQVRAAKLWGRVTPLHAFSVDAAAEYEGDAIGLLFIDADHEAASVKADFDAWAPYLASHALVVFDDYGTARNPGVAQVVDALVASGALVDCAPALDLGIAVARSAA